MKKIATFAVLTMLLIPFQGCFLKEVEPSEMSFDEQMDLLFEQNLELAEMKIELTMLVLETEDTGNIFEKFHEIDDQTDEILKTLDAIEDSLSGSDDTVFIPTAYAADEGAIINDVDTGLRSYGILKNVGNWYTNNQYRNQDEAMRMGIYTGYKEIEETFGEDVATYIDPILRDLGIADIEEIFYVELDKVETFYNQIDDLPEGYGQNFKWNKEGIYEALQNGAVEDVYAYIDNVAALIDDEIEAGQYGEYMPGYISDFMIRTIGYDEYVDYVEQRRQTKLELENQVVEDEWTPPNLADLIDEYEAEHGVDGEGGDYYDEGYEPGDDTETVITCNSDTGEVIVGQINTTEGNSLNLPEGSYDILGTTDGNLPVAVDSVPVTEGNTTTVYNTTTGVSGMVNHDFINFIANIPPPTIVMPTQADLLSAQTQLMMQFQLQSQLEYQLEIFNSMAGSAFVTISSSARTLVNGQLSDVNKEIERLQAEIAEMETLLGSVEIVEIEDEGPQYPETLDASGDWSSSYGDKGTINLSFPSVGGNITGNFGACPNNICWSSTAVGSFAGGDGGAVSGTISGHMDASEYTSYYTISGSFQGTVYLDWGYAEGTFTTTLTGSNGSSYSDSGEWSVVFDM